MRRLFGVALSLGIALLTAGSLRAETVVISLDGTDGESRWTDQIQVQVNDDGTFFGAGNSLTEAWDIDYLISGDIDPIVTANFSTQNLLGVPIIVTVNTFMPVAPPLGAPTATSGTVAYTVTDGSLPQDGATVAALAGSSLYEAVIDGSSFETLFDAPFALTAAAGDSATDNTNFGLPGQTTVGPAVTTSMEINYHFSLTPHDLVSITGNFVAVPIPEPSSIVLCGLGLLGAALVARRSAR